MSRGMFENETALRRTLNVYAFVFKNVRKITFYDGYEITATSRVNYDNPF